METPPQPDAVISVKQVGKVYRVYDKPQDRLKQMLFARFGKTYGRNFSALQNISFDVKRGEALGIIGRNGSGKSTLLQILAGTLLPSSGQVDVRGRVAALLELGSGFNPEFTGRENVYLNASLLGITRKQTDARFDEIASFADIGDFIDQPVKTYSSGMVIRLAFAVQTAIEPEILIIDEALSVGDFFFQQKCARRMRELQENGTTLLFVSHDMSVVRDLCRQAAYLRKGELVYVGSCGQAIKLYFQEGTSGKISTKSAMDRSRQPRVAEWVEQFRTLACWMGAQPEAVDGKDARLAGVALLDDSRNPVVDVVMGQELTFWILVEHFSEVPVSAAVVLKNRYDQVISSFGSHTLGLDIPASQPGSLSLLELKMTAMIEAGAYSFRVVIGPPSSLPNRGAGDETTPWLGPFGVSWDYEQKRAPFLGMFGVPVTGRFVDVQEIAN